MQFGAEKDIDTPHDKALSMKVDMVLSHQTLRGCLIEITDKYCTTRQDEA